MVRVRICGICEICGWDLSMRSLQLPKSLVESTVAAPINPAKHIRPVRPGSDQIVAAVLGRTQDRVAPVKCFHRLQEKTPGKRRAVRPDHDRRD